MVVKVPADENVVGTWAVDGCCVGRAQVQSCRTFSHTRDDQAALTVEVLEKAVRHLGDVLVPLSH